MRVLILIAVSALAACSPEGALVTANSSASLALARGHFGIAQMPDGSRKFTYVIAENAYDGLLSSDKHEEQRKYMLSGWMGEKGSCPEGYEIRSRQEAAGNVVYEGICL